MRACVVKRVRPILYGAPCMSEVNHSQSLMAGNFAVLWSKDPKSLALGGLSPFKIV